ncbi:MAG: hypothetical protein IIB36_19455 [Gemmatimonadetes bacterium]|nr:hypothetical protein [Gemmatimonadota bacterium]
MTSAHDHKEGRSGARPPSARLPQPLTGAPNTPVVARQAPESGKPTPVRGDLATPGVFPGASPDVEPDVGEATVEVDGTSWTVRVRGRSGGGSAVNTPLLLLGFWKVQSATSPPDREAFVVGRLLADMTAGDLEAALAESRDPADPDRRPAFFSEISERRRS